MNHHELKLYPLIADPEIIAIPIKECGEKTVDVKAKEDLAYGPPPECEETAPHYTLLRKTVYEKLQNAQKLLPQGYKFRLLEGYRSLKVQQMLFENKYTENKRLFPTASKAELYEMTTQLVSPVVNLDGSTNIPPHSTGGAFDIELIDLKGIPIDMGMDASLWASTDPNLSKTDSPLISIEAKKNRQILSRVLTLEGFVNYPTEWWHWSYGDRYWAFHKKMPYAIYGSLSN